MTTLAWRTIETVDGDIVRSNVVESGEKDAKGRTIGRFYVLEDRGGGFSLLTVPTRNGKCFGSVRLPAFVEGTLAEAQKAVEEML